MDYRYTPEDEAFRKEVRDFVKANWDDDRFHDDDVSNCSWDEGTPEVMEARHAFADALRKKGWYTMFWPKEYGGQAEDIPWSRAIAYQEEMGYNAAPGVGAGSAAIIMQHGNDWQKGFYIPQMASGEMEVALGLSEPGGGSDLANLQTSAYRDGDDWVVNGSKIWTSSAHHSNWWRLLVRTNPDLPKHRGLSLFVAPLDLPGITIHPINEMMGRRRWSQEFLENVRIPQKYMIGEENQGWYVNVAALNSERSSVRGPAHALHNFEKAVDAIRDRRINGGLVLDNPIYKHRLVDIRIAIAMYRTICLNAAWEEKEGTMSSRLASMSRIISGDLDQVQWRALATMLGQDSQLMPYSTPYTPYEGFLGVNAHMSSGRTFGHGTKEIQKGIIATRGLGLPR